MPTQLTKVHLKRLRHRIALLLKRYPLAYDLAKSFSRTWDRSRQYHFLVDIFQVSRAITILQIGANDGMRDDPIREFIVFNPRCTAWLVEPIPALQDALYANYRREIQENRVKILPYAISETEDELTLYKIKSSYADQLPDYAKGMISSNASHLLGRTDLRISSDDIEELRIPAISPLNLLSIINVHIDLLVIDVEGMEEELLMSFPWQHCAPNFILYESYHLSSQSTDAVNSLLAEHGYYTYNLGKDTAAVKIKWLLNARSFNHNIFRLVGENNESTLPF